MINLFAIQKQIVTYFCNHEIQLEASNNKHCLNPIRCPGSNSSPDNNNKDHLYIGLFHVELPLMGQLEKFAKRNMVDIMMFTWVNCFRMNFPTISIENAIKNFAKKNGKDNLQFNIESEMVKYYRMDKEYRELQSVKDEAIVRG